MQNMIRLMKCTIPLLLLFFAACKRPALDVDASMQVALQRYEKMLEAHPDMAKIPHSLNADSSLRDMPSDWWTSGFFAATLWQLYDYTKDEKWKSAAHKWTMAVEKEQFNTTTHDLGFMIYYPFGAGYRLTGDTAYKRIMLQGAASLASRFDSARGVIRSWDTFREFDYPVIIDNMMNLDFLFWASRETKDPRYHDISIRHADATLKNHFRPDFSSYHVVCYGPGGEVLAQKTHQGAADESVWSRGQAWALYGYTMMFRETEDRKYLVQAMHIADFLLNHPNLPDDKIFYWDLKAPNIPNEERDASAAAIVASGLLELSKFTNEEKSEKYISAAREMLISLSGPAYNDPPGNFLLAHSVGHKPGGIEVDVPLIYADFYYLEALMRYKALRQ